MRCSRCGHPVEGAPGAPCLSLLCRTERARRAARAADEAHRRQVLETLVEAGTPPRPPWSTTPFNGAEQVAVDPDRVAGLRARIHALAIEALAARAVEEGPDSPGGIEADGAGVDQQPPAIAAAVATACAGCRGWCCRKGGERDAFLSVETLLRAIRVSFDPDEDPSVDDVVGVYLSYIGETHAEGGCLFHGDRGCRLPRTVRSDLCNLFLCPELSETVAGWGADGTGPEGHTFVAVSPRDKRARGVRTVALRTQSEAKAASKAD